MAEEKQEKKKSALFWRILKWIGLGLLALLLIASIIFQAPLKVITLLVVILLACTVLPRPLRKWFWLSAAAVVIVLIIWVFLPDDNEGWRPFTFDEELAALEAKRAIPDSENAAIIYKRLLEDYDPNAMNLDFLNGELERQTRLEPWSSKDHPEIAEWLNGQQSTIATLLEAVKKEKCRFPISARIVMSNEWMIRLNATRQWAYLLIRAANNDLGEDRIDDAIEKYLCVIQMAKHVYQQPEMIDKLVGIAIEALAIRQFNGFIIAGDATAEHLRIIEESLAQIKHDWSYDLTKILEYEKLMAKNTICNLAYETNAKGKVRLRRDPPAAMRAQFWEELPPLTYWQKKLKKAKTISHWFFMPSTLQKAGKIIDEGFERYYAMAEPDFDWKKEPKEVPIPTTPFLSVWPSFNQRQTIEFLAGMSEKIYYRFHEQYLRVFSNKRGCQILIALRRHKNKTGHWPEQLAEIKSLAPAEIFVDPVNGDSFIYKLTDDGFKLYSKGKNNIDDNGEYKDGADDWLIWPPRIRKANSLLGRALPELKDLQIELPPADANDKMILVCFWDMQQRPSRHCVSQLAQMAEELKEKGVIIVAVQASKIDTTELNQWLEKFDIPFPVGIIDGDEERVRSAWRVKSLPWLILADTKHVVRAEGFGLVELEAKVEENAP